MKKLVLYVLLLTTVLSLDSCGRAVEKALSNIRIEGVESIEHQGMTGVEVVLRVMNNTRHKLMLETATLDLYYMEDHVSNITLRRKVEVPGRTTGSFSSLWRIRTQNPMTLQVLTKKIQEQDISQICVSFDVKGRGGPAPVKMSQEMMPLSEFLNTFGVSLDELKNYLEE